MADAQGVAKIAVLMAVFNGAKFIGEQIDSVLNQTYKDFKLVVLDDGSTDRSADIVTDYMRRDARITLFRNEKNLGVIKTFEKLLSFVDTPYFCFCDQDDVWLPSKLEFSLRKIEESGADLVYTDLILVDEKLNALGVTMWQHARIHPIRGNDVLPLIIKSTVTGCTLLARSRLIPVCLPFPEGIYMYDWWMAVAAASQGGIAYLTEPQVLYRQHSENLLGGGAGTRHFFKRLERRGMSFRDHLVQRLAARNQLLRHAAERFDRCARYRCLITYYTLPSWARLILTPFYFSFLVIFARKIGVRWILRETLMTGLPLSLGRLIDGMRAGGRAIS